MSKQITNDGGSLKVVTPQSTFNIIKNNITGVQENGTHISIIDNEGNDFQFTYVETTVDTVAYGTNALLRAAIESLLDTNTLGAATAANQATEIASLASIDSKTPNLAPTSSPSVSAVASSAIVVTLLALNTSRKGALIVNDSTEILYVKYGSGATTSSYSFAISAKIGSQSGYWEMPLPTYTGIITGIWSGVNGEAKITEF